MKRKTIMVTESTWPGPEDQGVYAVSRRHESYVLSNRIDQAKLNEDISGRIKAQNLLDGDCYELSISKHWIREWIVALYLESIKRGIEIPEWLESEKWVIDAGLFVVGYEDDTMEALLVCL